MLSASSNYNVPLVFAGLLVLALLGVVMSVAAAALELRTSAWAFRGSEIVT
jgi:NitT/TauT family transport system permease protein